MKFPIAVISLLVILLYGSACVSHTPDETQLLYGYYKIEGDSMQPTLQPPIAVLVKPVPFDDVSAGDIVIFSYRNNLIVHRAVKKIGNAWLTQGDNLKNRDSMKVTRAIYRGTVYIDRLKRTKGDVQDDLLKDVKL